MNQFSIADAASAAPERIALYASGQSFTFSDLANGAARAAAWLRTVGLPAHAVVAFAPRATLESLHMLYALMALNHPIALLHPRWSSAERLQLLQAWKPAHEIPEHWWQEPLGAALAPLAALEARAPLAIVPTSGSSATPKGVILAQRAFAAAARAHSVNVGWTPSDRWLLSLPLAHVGGLNIVTRCLQARSALVLPDADQTSAGTELAQTLAARQVTLLSLVPTQLARLLALPDWDLPVSVRAILLGGAPADASLLSACAERHWPVLPTYGLSEACSQVATREYARRYSAASDVGRPVQGVELRLVAGEIVIRGPQLFDGYYPDAGADARRAPEAWFATGDLGELDQHGRLLLLGRKSELLITGGENVHPLEVERCLLGCPGVEQACVFGLPDPLWGQSITAAIVPRAGAALSSQEVHAFANAALANFRRPRRIFLVPALPLTASGKVDRRALAEQCQALRSLESPEENAR